MRGQLAIARELGATQVRCVATAGVRRAGNGDALVALIRASCGGLEVEILTGAEEARLAFIGAAWGAGALADGSLGVVDAGGGSIRAGRRHRAGSRPMVGIAVDRIGRRDGSVAAVEPTDGAPSWGTRASG